MHAYIIPLKALLEQNADPSQAAPMKKYMRDQFEYLGIETPKNIALQKQFYDEYGLPELSALDEILRDLWALPQREFQYVAVGLLGKFEKQLQAELIDTIEYLIVTKPWWDTVDAIAGHTVGTYCQRYQRSRKIISPAGANRKTSGSGAQLFCFNLTIKKKRTSTCCVISSVRTWTQKSSLSTKPLAGR